VRYLESIYIQICGLNEVCSIKVIKCFAQNSTVLRACKIDTQANARVRKANKKRMEKYVASHLFPCSMVREDANSGSASTVDPDTFSSTDDPTEPMPRSLSLTTWRSESESPPDQHREINVSVDATYNAVPLHETSRCTNPVISNRPGRQRPHRTPSADIRQTADSSFYSTYRSKNTSHASITKCKQQQ